MFNVAVIKTGGKQYKVALGEEIKIEKLNGAKGDKVKFDTLLAAVGDGKEVKIGRPFLAKKASGEIIEQGKGEKVKVIKYKNKTRYKRTLGHRQPFTKVKITSIG